MALPKWITPAGDLGIVPELEYYQYLLDAYDPSAGALVYSLVSGRLPLGIQVVTTGRLQGIPVSELGGDQNVTYTFTIRVKNSSTNGLSDRTFSLTVTNVAPPIINVPTRNSYLGLFLDGTEYTKQLEAIEATPGETLTWSLKNGDLPPGLTLSSNGVLTGYFEPVPNPAAGRDPDWDQAAWDFLGWQSSLYAIKKRFTFTIKVTDGVNSDLSTYTLDVYPRSSLTADHDDITVDLTLLGTGVPLTIDAGNKHNPIITTTQANLIPVREGSYFSFKLNAVDLDGDAITWSVPTLVTGAFDEQISPLYNYVASQLVSGRLSAGIFPDVSTVIDSLLNTSVSSLDYTQAYLEPGDTVKILNASNVWQLGTITSSVTVRITGNTLISASAGQWLTQASSGANATITDVSNTTGNIVLTGSIYTGYINTLRPTYQITFNGNIYANVGDYITQSVSGANARVTDAVGNAIVGSTTANIIYITGNFTNGNAVSGSNIAIRGLSVARYPTANVKDIFNTTITANVGEYITQTGYTGNAVITANIIDDIRVPVTFLSGTFNPLGGNVRIGNVDVGVWINNVQSTSTAFGTAATVGQYITQASTGANAVVTANVVYGTTIPVRFISNTFITGSTAGNLALASANINAYPTSVLCSTDITATYNTANYFDLNTNLTTTIPQINTSALTYSNITSIVSVGVTLGSLATEGTVGFDSSASGFDQGVLDLPPGLSLVEDSGWLIGTLPSQTVNQVEYEFRVVASKTSDLTYQDTQLFTLTILGDLNNRIDWVTPADLGTITTGKVSDLFIYATSTLGKTLFYELTAGTYHRLPQGLQLTLGGLISGRASFEVFSLDQGTTTVDGESTTFDFTYTFTVTARDLANTISADRTFTLTIRQFDKIPYENLYLKALPSAEQRASFQTLVNDTTIFPLEKIYRHEDPWFGLSTDIKTLFLAGLSPSALEKYTQVASTNHYTKRLTFGDVKTARALDQNFNVKYEVVYVEVQDANTNSFGQGPADTLDLINDLDTPYYDADGNSYTTAYPNSVVNMGNVMVGGISYQDKGVLPDWMTSRQINGRQLGFVRAVVLAYVKPGESDLISYRLRQRNFNFNSIDFTVDRYQLDNVYSTNYDLTANAFVTSRETTFDRYPALTSTLTYATTVDFAVSTAFEDINEHYVNDIKVLGGMDGIRNFKDGDTIVFAKQEYTATGSTLVDYTQGWSNSIVLWDETSWAYNTDTSDNDTLTPEDPTLIPPNLGPYDTTPGQKWDQANYIPGYNEYNLGTTYADGTSGFPTSPSDGDLTTVTNIVYSYDADSSRWRVANQRAAVWQINISTDNIVTLTLIRGIDFYDTIFVRNGFTYGGTNIYFDPITKSGKTMPDYSIVPQQIRTTYTTFDGNGTRFYDYRDSYVVPGQGDKYIKFTKIGVFT
jgi:hypothetical protein